MSYRRSAVCVTTLIAVLFASLPGPARAQLVVSASTPARTRLLESWYSAHIPARFRVRAKLTVRELTNRQMATYLKEDGEDGDAPPLSSQAGDDGDGDIDGVYEGDPPRITLRIPDDGTPDLFTFAHEYGHYVWFEVFGKEDRRRYESLYKKQRASHHLVTRYAASDVEEGFAEAFSFYVNEAPLLAHRDPVSYQFLVQRAADSRPKADDE